ncbi:MAG: hypothetical protein AAEJ53_11260 [Myxococcota bacterium]
MEDRINPVLYLEMSDAEPTRYHATRTPEVMALPGVERMTLFSNLHYQRKDFEPDFIFRVQDFRTLAVFEANSHFQAPELPEGLRGLHFLHYPRPAQGFLSEEPTKGLMLVLISAREESGAQALRDWADFVHLPPLAVGDLGFSMITPYENATRGEPRFMHFYETPSADAEAALHAEVHDFPARYGGVDTDAYRHWQTHENLVVDYINTFERVGDA